MVALVALIFLTLRARADRDVVVAQRAIDHRDPDLYRPDGRAILKSFK